MKKLLSLAAVVLTAALIFSGCQNASSSSDDGDKLPGTWASTAEFNDNYDPPFDNVSSFTHKGNGVFEYKVTNASGVAAGKKPPSGKFIPLSYRVTKDADYTGFKITSISSSTTYHGVSFNITVTDNKWSYYRLLLSDKSYNLDLCEAGTETELKGWTQHNAIKASTEENLITVYADKDSNIHIQINNVEIYKIEKPKLKQGQIGPVCCLSDLQVTGNSTFTTTYTFKEFQKK